MKADVEAHANRVSGWQPSVLRVGREDENRQDGLLLDDRTKERRPCDPLGLLEALVEDRTWWGRARSHLGRNREHPVES